MKEETSDDELPSISIDCLSQDSSLRESVSVMPSAGEVAAARERERHTELELLRLRAATPPLPAPALPGDPALTPVPRSDSSGSEGEAALAQAVRSLLVSAPGGPRAGAGEAAARLAVARHLLSQLAGAPPALLAALADDVPPAARSQLVDRVVHGLSCALASEEAGAGGGWPRAELVSCAAVLAAAWLAAPAPAARRALHRALQLRPHSQEGGGDDGGSVARELARLAARAARPAGPRAAARALLALSGAARGGPPPAELLAALLVRRSLAALLDRGDDERGADEPLSAHELAARLEGWRGLPAGARLAALRLAGRVLAAGGPAASRARVLAALAQQPGGAAARQDPDYLKVVVAASTLQLLFRPQP